MDCKIYLADGQIVTLNNINSVRAADKEGSELLVISVFNDENTRPLAMFRGIGYELTGRPVSDSNDKR